MFIPKFQYNNYVLIKNNKHCESKGKVGIFIGYCFIKSSITNRCYVKINNTTHVYNEYDLILLNEDEYNVLDILE